MTPTPTYVRTRTGLVMYLDPMPNQIDPLLPAVPVYMAFEMWHQNGRPAASRMLKCIEPSSKLIVYLDLQQVECMRDNTPTATP